MTYEHQTTSADDEQRAATQASIRQSQLWLQTNRENYRGEWVVFKGGELIAHGKEELGLCGKLWH